jgi:hypothetical protein
LEEEFESKIKEKIRMKLENKMDDITEEAIKRYTEEEEEIVEEEEEEEIVEEEEEETDEEIEEEEEIVEEEEITDEEIEEELKEMEEDIDEEIEEEVEEEVEEIEEVEEEIEEVEEEIEEEVDEEIEEEVDEEIEEEEITDEEIEEVEEPEEEKPVLEPLTDDIPVEIDKEGGALQITLLDVQGDAIPFGYILKKGKLEIKEDEAMKIKLIFSGYYLQEKSLEEISKITRLSVEKIEKILINPIYFGKIYFEGTIQEGDFDPIITDKYCKINKINVAEIEEKYLSSL